ncbi:hypothetical protein [Gloeobacter morelensis]|uniref:Uncharacterized protein n=1 Tax=Gloeobacter morelensis MG652769 TaxID=2781736 RepID=A0ABY3PG15_9CYAN|nr:hypothetical protein [Gloeobacter morelensis]UFP92593.1 hypothetical protein ISF26_12125 [Gloeobacter morelensis MG652769]
MLPSQHEFRRRLQILAGATGIAITLAACATLGYAAHTGQMPFWACGAIPLVLLCPAAVLACLAWAESI